MFRIGEFAVLTSISIHMLRNYDKIGLLSPDHTDPWTGYRYYSESQLIRANRIQSLKAMGLGLKEITQMLESDSSNNCYKELLLQKISEKKEEIKKCKEELKKLELSLEKVNHEDNYIFDVAVKKLPVRNVVSYRSKIHTYSEESRLWNYLGKACKENSIKIVPNGFAAAIWHERDHGEHTLDIEVVFEVDTQAKNVEGLTSYQLPECEVASIAFQGQYYEIGNIISHLGRWIDRNNYKVCGNPYSIYYVSPGNTSKEEDYLTEICFPIKKKK